MDRAWMYDAPRHGEIYIRGLSAFIEAAEKDALTKKTKEIYCPCSDCKNQKMWDKSSIIKSHLILRGFVEGYKCWSNHGEQRTSEPNEDIVVDQVDADDEGAVVGGTDVMMDDGADVDLDDDADFDLEEMLRHAEPHVLRDTRGLDKFESLQKASSELLYSESKGCDKEFTVLHSVLELLRLKASNGWSDKSFSDLLSLLANMLPKPNSLPTTTYLAKKLICPLSLDVQKIHACPNHCILYRKEYEALDRCPVCNASRYKRNDDCDEDEDASANAKKKKKSNAGGDEEDTCSNAKKKRRSPAMVMWYLPVIPRLQRLYSNPRDSELMRWHFDKRKKDGTKLRHPADARQWRKIDDMYPEFAEEPRNVRFALSTDGMNPFGDMSTSHSTWPVVLAIYNLPPWLCMKRKYLILSILIQGPKQPGNDIDVFLEPLMEDMAKLWNEGVRVWDEFRRQYFTLKAMIFVTINDYPALFSLSGQVKGKQGCAVCLDETASVYLPCSQKVVYTRHRRFLLRTHRYRKMKKHFDDTVEEDTGPKPRSGAVVFQMVSSIKVVFGKPPKGKKRKKSETPTSTLWKKMPIFFKYLPYWKDLDVRHSIDVMHVEKNVCDSILGLLLDIPGKTKDGIKSRKDLVHFEIRPELHPEDRPNGKHYLPPASYSLTTEEKKALCKCLRGVRVPTGYSSNIKNLVSMKDLKLIGMKSHDCHVMMTQMLPIAIRAIKPRYIKVVITRLCHFLNAIAQKVIDAEKLGALQSYLVETLCQLEMCLPPSFFDIMVHLLVHIVNEITALGPVFLHQMYAFERYMGILKGYVRNRAHPEGSMIEGYSTEEVVECCIDYIKDSNPIGVPVSRHEGRLTGRGTKGKKRFIDHDYKAVEEAHFTILQQLKLVAPYVEQHLDELHTKNQGRPYDWILKEHKRRFTTWFKNQNLSEGDSADKKNVKMLACGPSSLVTSWQAYDINGYTFYTKAKDKKSTTQNSGVRIEADDTTGKKVTYYGFIDEIWELDYGLNLQIPVFRCKWVKHPNGVAVDNYGFTTVDLSLIGHKNDPWVLADHVAHVFYIIDPANEKKHVVVAGKQRIVGVENVEDEEEYNQFDDVPPFGDPGKIKLVEATLDRSVMPYMRLDGVGKTVQGK